MLWTGAAHCQMPRTNATVYASASPAIHTHNICKTYPATKQQGPKQVWLSKPCFKHGQTWSNGHPSLCTQVLRGIDLVVPRGTLHMLLGRTRQTFPCSFHYPPHTPSPHLIKKNRCQRLWQINPPTCPRWTAHPRTGLLSCRPTRGICVSKSRQPGRHAHSGSRCGVWAWSVHTAAARGVTAGDRCTRGGQFGGLWDATMSHPEWGAKAAGCHCRGVGRTSVGAAV